MHRLGEHLRREGEKDRADAGDAGEADGHQEEVSKDRLVLAVEEVPHEVEVVRQEDGHQGERHWPVELGVGGAEYLRQAVLLCKEKPTPLWIFTRRRLSGAQLRPDDRLVHRLAQVARKNDKEYRADHQEDGQTANQAEDADQDDEVLQEDVHHHQAKGKRKPAAGDKEKAAKAENDHGWKKTPV